jgi:PIN domain nuclease of toxin-antitoxin system
MFVTDTHPLIFYLFDRKRLSKAATEAFEQAVSGKAMLYIPSAVLWEISLNVKTGNSIQLGGPFEGFVTRLLQPVTFLEVPVTAEIIELSHELDFHDDPFDSIIVATAQHLGFPLITADNVITKAKPCDIVWN